MNEVDSHIPEYTLEEKEKEILIIIIAPLSKPKEAAFVLEKAVFTFDSPPYLLKIKLPCPVSDRFSQQSYDNDTRTYKIKLKKSYDIQEEESDEEDEVLSAVTNTCGEESSQKDVGNEEKQFYGFANMYSKMFGELYNEFSEVINLPDPDHTDISRRKILREKEENEKWNEDHYLADTMETNHLQSIFKYKPPWITSPLNDKDDYRNDENEILQELTNKSKITELSDTNIQLSEFQIVDILFSYAYNVRTTEGDNTVESWWTINKLSSTLSWFEVFNDLKSVLLSCYRRSLIFPLYRNWNLTQMIHKDVINILKTGSKQVTRCLLEVRDIFNESGYCYILNTLYLNDLCNFAFHTTNTKFLTLSEEVNKVAIKKFEVNPDLPLLEIAAHLTLEEEGKSSDETGSNVTKIIDKITELHLNSKNSSSSESENSESSSQSSSNED